MLPALFLRATMDETRPELAGRWTVEEDQTGRLDRLLTAVLPDFSRTRLQEAIRDGGVFVDGLVQIKPAFPLECGMVVELKPVARSRERRGSAEGMDFQVVFEDEHLAVVNKPAGMVTHPAEVVKGGTVSELAVERWGELPSPQGPNRPGIVHRLDAETSGLLVVAKTEAAATGLLEAFRERTVEKTYTAFVYGDPRFDSDWVEAAIGRNPKKPDRMSVVKDEEGRPAETFYETRARFGRIAWMAAHPKTGRTHQIRVHLAHVEHPIVGDRLYRGRRGLSLKLPDGVTAPERLALHAERLAFAHPVTGEAMEFHAELPQDLAAFLEALRQLD